MFYTPYSQENLRERLIKVDQEMHFLHQFEM